MNVAQSHKEKLIQLDKLREQYRQATSDLDRKIIAHQGKLLKRGMGKNASYQETLLTI